MVVCMYSPESFGMESLIRLACADFVGLNITTYKQAALLSQHLPNTSQQQNKLNPLYHKFQKTILEGTLEIWLELPGKEVAKKTLSHNHEGELPFQY
jgi:hypothetical protein